MISCHGDACGLLLPELHPSVEEVQRYRGALAPADLSEFLRLPDRIVINTGCSMGTPEHVQAFLRAGCSAYIAPDGDPEGDQALVYIVNLLYHHLCRAASLEEAHARASAHEWLFRLNRAAR